MNTELTKDGKVWAKTQHELPCEIKAVDQAEEDVVECGVAAMTEDAYNVYISGEGFTYTFSKHYGAFISMIVDGEEQLAGKSVLSAFRAPTDNDRHIINKWAMKNKWEGENLDCTFSKIYDCIVVDSSIKLAGSLAGISRLPFLRYEQTVTVSKEGEITYAMTGKVREEAVWLPRLGYEFELPESSKVFTYYGHGPLENYCDMHNWSPVGMYTSDTEKEYVNYVRPQEHGNHTKVKMLQIGKLEFLSQMGMEINVSGYSTAALYKAEHTDELMADGKTHLRIDYKVSGIGSHSCGPMLEEEYRLSEKKIAFGFVIKPVHK